MDFLGKSLDVVQVSEGDKSCLIFGPYVRWCEGAEDWDAASEDAKINYVDVGPGVSKKKLTIESGTSKALSIHEIVRMSAVATEGAGGVMDDSGTLGAPLRCCRPPSRELQRQDTGCDRSKKGAL